MDLIRQHEIRRITKMELPDAGWFSRTKVWQVLYRPCGIKDKEDTILVIADDELGAFQEAKERLNIK